MSEDGTWRAAPSRTAVPAERTLDASPTADQLQRAIASVPGVVAAEVARGDDGRDRLRISLAPGEDPEAIAWSVAAVLRERFDIALDPAAISARAIADPVEDAVRVISRIEPTSAGATIWRPEDRSGATTSAAADDGPDGEGAAAADEGTAPDDPPVTDAVGAARDALAARARESAGGPMRRRRAAIAELGTRNDGDEVGVTATLRLAGHEVSGRAKGVRTRRGRWRAISEATLDALGALTAQRVRGHVDHVTVLSFTELAHVSVSVTLLTDRGEETFLGASLIHDDPDRAVMRATLDAVNRRVEPWLDTTTVVYETA